MDGHLEESLIKRHPDLGKHSIQEIVNRKIKKDGLDPSSSHRVDLALQTSTGRPESRLDQSYGSLLLGSLIDPVRFTLHHRSPFQLTHIGSYASRYLPLGYHSMVY